jgi:glycosyltransferase involved in cell wall biosynthesis
VPWRPRSERRQRFPGDPAVRIARGFDQADSLRPSPGGYREVDCSGAWALPQAEGGAPTKTWSNTIACLDTQRALFLCPELDAGGAESHWASLLPALAGRGINVRVIAIKGGGRALESLRADGIPVRELGYAGMGSVKALPNILEERRGNPRVIVTMSENAHALGAAFSRLTRTPQIVNWHHQPGLQIVPLHRRVAVRLAALAGAGVIAVSSAQLAELRRFGFAPRRTVVIPNGVPAPAAAGVPRQQLRAELGLPEDAFLAVLVARLRPEKRVGDFLAALGALRESTPAALGIVVGDGPLEDDLRHQASEEGVPVRFVGFQGEPTKYMLAADVVCLTSEFEALPMALIEAAACGRPCIATRVGGIHEVIDGGVSGLLVEPGSTDAFSAALSVLAQDRALRDSMGRQALERWRRLFTFEAMVDGYFDLLTKVSGPPTKIG